jgi:hypothetical protein
MKIAAESPKILRARKKLEQQFEREKREMTPEAMREAAEGIRKSIASYAKERVPVKDKIGLFDGGQNTAAASKAIKAMAAKMGLI